MKKIAQWMMMIGMISGLAMGQIAFDSAENYEAWGDGMNLGSGFEEWRLSNSDGGNFLGDAGNLGSNAAAINTEGQAFGIWATGTSDAFRNLDAPLSEGQTFSFEFAFRNTSGDRGFDLRSGESTIFNFNIDDGGFNWTGGNSAPLSLWEGNRENGMVIRTSFTATATGFDYAFTSPQDVNLNTGGTVVSSAIDEIVFYINNTQGGGENDFFFNNLEVIPEPGTAMLLVGGLGVLMWLRRRRG